MEGVNRIIAEASIFEDPGEVQEQQHEREECIKEAGRTSEHDIGHIP